MLDGGTGVAGVAGVALLTAGILGAEGTAPPVAGEEGLAPLVEGAAEAAGDSNCAKLLLNSVGLPERAGSGDRLTLEGAAPPEPLPAPACCCTAFITGGACVCVGGVLGVSCSSALGDGGVVDSGISTCGVMISAAVLFTASNISGNREANSGSCSGNTP